MSFPNYLTFLLIAVGYIASPGPAVFIAIYGGAHVGVLKTSVVVLGNTLGLALLAFISALGLGQLILESPLLTACTQIMGASWLGYMGVKMMLSHLDTGALDSSLSMLGNHDQYFRKFYNGLLLALTNPKPIIFFVSIYPQFIEPVGSINWQLFLLGVTFISLSFFILNFYSYASSITLGKILNAQRIRVFNLLFGGGFIVLGILLLLPLIMSMSRYLFIL